jgi:hypothetical protein
VQAQVGGVWSNYSAFKTFTVTATGAAKAGFWEDPAGMEFYVTTNQANVDNFAVYISVTGGTCPGNYKITHNPAEPITNKNFSFTGAFHASGTFDTLTTAHGSMGLTDFQLCAGTVITAGPWSWSATWQNNNQPITAADGAAAAVIAAPASKGHFTINIE